MRNHGGYLGLLCATVALTAIAGCSSSGDGTKSDMAAGGTSAGGGRASGSAGGASSGSTSIAGANGGATASGGASGACTPNYACKPVAPNTGDPEADCVARVNQFRACVCLPPLAADPAGKDCADQQAAYDAMMNVPHAGFGANICMPQFYAQSECPGYASQQATIDGCAQQMFDEGPPPMEPCDGTCYEMHGHFINMTGNYKMVTCGFATAANGKVWTVQNFR